MNINSTNENGTRNFQFKSSILSMRIRGMVYLIQPKIQ